MRVRRFVHQLLSLLASTSLLLTSFMPVAQATPLAQEPVTHASIRPVVAGDAALYRTRITIDSLARRQRLDELGIVVLAKDKSAASPSAADNTAWTAIVLADDEQLETLARLRYEPQASDEFVALVQTNTAANTWLSAGLRPLVTQAATLATITPLSSAGEGPEVRAAIDARAVMRISASALTREQRAALADLTSLDDDADGLTNAQEAWWCTDPLNADTDGDGVSDGDEVQAAKDWLANKSSSPPASGKPYVNWPDELTNCTDDDRDAVPDLAERWELGLNMNRESTDGDKFDDGQELFGLTKPGYGDYPRSVDSFITSNMPGWVDPPGNSPFVAAFPQIEIEVVPDSIGVELISEITVGETKVEQQSYSYETSRARGSSVSIGTESSHTFGTWQEVGNSQADSIERGQYQSDMHTDVQQYNWEHTVGRASEVERGWSTETTVGLENTTGSEIGSSVDRTKMYSMGDQYDKSVAYETSTEHGVDVDKGLGINVSFGTARTNSMGMSENYGIDYGTTNGTSSTDLSSQTAVNLVTSGQSGAERNSTFQQDSYGGVSGTEIGYEQGTSYSVSQIHERSAIHGAGYESTQTTTFVRTQYEEFAVTNGYAIANAQEWSTARAVDTSRAAQLTFSYWLRNSGTDRAQSVEQLVFNIFIGGSDYPITYYAAPSEFGLLNGSNPGDKNLRTSSPILLSLEQLRMLDGGASVRVVLEEISYGANEDDFYENAWGNGVLFEIDDGNWDGNEALDSYLIATWGEENYQDVLKRFLPITENEEGDLVLLSSPEYGENGEITRWNDYPVTELSWWNVYLSDYGDGQVERFRQRQAASESRVLMRFNRDSDGDRYSDRTERNIGTDHLNPLDHPSAEIAAGFFEVERDGYTEVHLALHNVGNYPAFGVEAQMYKWDDSVEVGKDLVGLAGRIAPGETVLPGSDLNLSSLDRWRSTGQPLIGGYYVGPAHSIYTFTVNSNGTPGQTSGLVLDWQNSQGDSGQIPVGDSYAPGGHLAVANGLRVGLGAASVNAGDRFSVEAVASWDVFTYTATQASFTAPMVLVSYNDAQGNKRIVTPVRLTQPTEDLGQHIQSMQPAPQLELIAPQPFNANGENSLTVSLFNPLQNSMQDGHLIVAMATYTGGILSLSHQKMTFDPGPNTFTEIWSVDDFVVAYDPDMDYKVRVYATDADGRILDVSTMHFAEMGRQAAPQAAFGETNLNVGQVRRYSNVTVSTAVANTGHHDLWVGIAPSVGLTSASGAKVVPGDLRKIAFDMETSNLPLGPFTLQAVLRTNDPLLPEKLFTISGEIVETSDSAVTVEPLSLYRPLDELVTIPGPKEARDVVEYQHGIATDAARVHPLYIYSIDDGDITGIGEYSFDPTGTFQTGNVETPAARAYHGMAYDSRRNVIVMYGGCAGSRNVVNLCYADQYLADTWEWDGRNWHQIETTNSPGPRILHAMTYDAKSGQTLLYGGRTLDPDGNSVFDLWGWDGRNWTLLEQSPFSSRFTDTEPYEQYGDFVYNSSKEVAVLISKGYPESEPSTIWEWNGAQWQFSYSVGSPYALLGAYDTARNALIYLEFRYTWIYNGSTRQDCGRSGGFLYNDRHGDMAYDLSRNQVLFFGSLHSSPYLYQQQAYNLDRPHQTRVLNGCEWTQLNPLNSPSVIEGHKLLYSPKGKGILLFGGSEFNDVTRIFTASDETWWWDGENWTQLFGQGFDIRKLAESGAIELILPTPSSSALNYHVHYGLRAERDSAGQETLHINLPYRQYHSFNFDLLLSEASDSPPMISIDIGADGSVEWQPSFAQAPSIQASVNLASGLNRYLATLGEPTGQLVSVPIRVSLDRGGDLFLTNVVAEPLAIENLSLISVQMDGPEPVEGATLPIRAVVHNSGTESVLGATVAVFAESEDGTARYVGSNFVKTLAPNASEQVAINWNTLDYTGIYTITAVIDPYTRLSDSNRNDNQGKAQVHVLSRPDLETTEVALSNPEPVVGETVYVSARVYNRGQTAAANHRVALASSDGGAALLPVANADVNSLLPGSSETVQFEWTPTQPGQQRIFLLTDEQNVVSEGNEANNRTYADIYVGFASPLAVDSGTTNDIGYSEERGYGAVDSGTTDEMGSCGGALHQTFRRDPTGRVIYRFDHLQPGHFYHLDLILYECGQNAGRQQRVSVDGMEIAGPIDLGSGEIQTLSLLLDPALYTDRSIEVAVSVDGTGGALVNQIALVDVDYRYADAGSEKDVQYPTGARPYGWLDGVKQIAWGLLPYQSLRENQSGREVRYRFDALDPNKNYQVHFTFFQGSGNNRVQQIWVDDVIPLTGDFTLVAGQRNNQRVDLPKESYADGTVTIEVRRSDGATTGAMINEIALEEVTQARSTTCQVATTPSWSLAFGNVAVAGQPAAVGTIVTAENPRGDVVGCFVVTSSGQYGFVSVYGEDASGDPVIQGMRTGEPVIFRVNGVIAVPTPLMTWQDNKTRTRIDLAVGITESQYLLLRPNWNLFSTRMTPPVPLLGTVFQSIAEKYCLVLGARGIFDCTVPTSFQSLKEIAPGKAYYTKINGGASVNMTIEGVPLPLDTSISLEKGLNWVGYLPTAKLPIATALASINAQLLQVADGQGQIYDPAEPGFSNLLEMTPGHGYLIHLSDTATLVYPGTGVAQADEPEISEEMTGTGSVHCGGVEPTPYFTAIYGRLSINGVDAMVGDQVEVLTPRNEVAGCFTVTTAGQYGFLSVFGADAGHEHLPGFVDGEAMTLRVNGTIVERNESVIWRDDKSTHRLDLDAITVEQTKLYLPFTSR